MDEPINTNPDFKGAFGDKRIEKRAVVALRKLRAWPSSITSMKVGSFIRIIVKGCVHTVASPSGRAGKGA
ncbi:hypothetical protein HQ865_19290 [Mucilaginibacter mali]|uniref:Uncharacterized protein n=1 Tax=Mucilaginibacter mali TaxID=2740462 RepID=A0A7D4UQ27_9SPHI|nr:hypothetical protein [Mucilaginibacter mali]QKJ31820.1 hypothetical protein HQ865_19290 [Mucilaginibacter mali]